jgi:hypothetical protein
MIVRKEVKANFKKARWVEHKPESEDERLGVIRAIDQDVANMKSGKIRTHRYTLSEFKEKFS